MAEQLAASFLEQETFSQQSMYVTPACVSTVKPHQYMGCKVLQPWMAIHIIIEAL